jgi:hypothetical protein
VDSTKFHVSVSGGRRSRVPRTDLMEAAISFLAISN